MNEILTFMAVANATGALLYYALAWLLDWVRCDDPVVAAPVHLGTGAWGMLMVAFFANEEYLDGATPDTTGIFFGGSVMLLAWQLAATLLDFVWSMATCNLMFWTLNKFGVFRVSEEAELMGMDQHHHGGSAYVVENLFVGLIFKQRMLVMLEINLSSWKK